MLFLTGLEIYYVECRSVNYFRLSYRFNTQVAENSNTQDKIQNPFELRYRSLVRRVNPNSYFTSITLGIDCGNLRRQ